MKKMLSGIALLLADFVWHPGAAVAQPLTKSATCKLTNTEAGKTLYEGACDVTPSVSGSNTVISVKMGNA